MSSSSSTPSPASTASHAYKVEWRIQIRAEDRTKPYYRLIGTNAPCCSIINKPGVCAGHTIIKRQWLQKDDQLTLRYKLETQDCRYHIVAPKFGTATPDFDVVENTPSRFSFTTTRKTPGTWSLKFEICDTSTNENFIIDPEITHSDEPVLIWFKIWISIKKFFGL